MSEEHSVLEDIPDRISPATASNMLLWVVVTMVVMLFGWAALTKIDRTVRGQGKVIPSSQLQTISNLEGGVVSQILIKVRSSASIRPSQRANWAAAKHRPMRSPPRSPGCVPR